LRVDGLLRGSRKPREDLLPLSTTSWALYFASWYMMNGGDLYELAKLMGHANIKMTERYAKLGRAHITKTGTTAKVIWNMMDKKRQEQKDGDKANIA
jgi:integrase